MLSLNEICYYLEGLVASYLFFHKFFYEYNNTNCSNGFFKIIENLLHSEYIIVH